MHDNNRTLYNVLRISGPIIFFIIVFVVLNKVADFSIVKSGFIAGVIAVLDYFALTYVMKKVG